VGGQDGQILASQLSNLNYEIYGICRENHYEKIKAKDTKPQPMVMMVTAYGDAENFNKAKELGADDFLTKPVDFMLLKEKLNLNK
jgi:CheY-like chemotaxis protein